MDSLTENVWMVDVIIGWNPVKLVETLEDMTRYGLPTPDSKLPYIPQIIMTHLALCHRKSRWSLCSINMWNLAKNIRIQTVSILGIGLLWWKRSEVSSVGMASLRCQTKHFFNWNMTRHLRCFCSWSQRVERNFCLEVSDPEAWNHSDQPLAKWHFGPNQMLGFFKYKS